MSPENENNSFSSDPNAFGLPEGYFQKSAGAILSKLEWLEEHKQFPLLQKFPRESVFQVPTGYFDRQADQLELLNTPVLASLKKQGVFSVPSDYFEERMLNELASQPGEDEPLLALIPRENHFKVDPAYFSKNEQRLRQLLLQTEQPPRVMPLFGARTWMAAAAVLLLTFGVWLYDFYFVPVATSDCGTVACVDKQDLLKSKTLESLESDELYDLVNSEKLEEKLNTKSTQNSNGSQKDSSHKKNNVSDDVLDEI